MSILHSARYGAVCVAVGVIAACSSSPPQITSATMAGAQPDGRGVPSGHIDRRESWMSPEASKEQLLYISSNSSPANVFAFSLPQLHLVGTLTGFRSPQGLCVDPEGDIWVTDPGSQQIFEYAHGGTTPIATLSEMYYHPVECSVDPTTGNLAVVNGPINGAPINVAVYPSAQGTPKYYTDYNVEDYYYCGYDNDGNLFVDALSQSSHFALIELRAGAAGFNSVTLNQVIGAPGGVQFADHFLAILDEDDNVIYQFAVNADGQGREVGATTLSDASNSVKQLWIQDKRVIVADPGALTTWFYHYPGGGNPFNALEGYGKPIGVTISRATK